MATDASKLNIPDLISSIEGIKSQGNALFQKGNEFLEEAIAKYQLGVNELDSKLKADVRERGHQMELSKDERNQVLFLKATLLSNMAMCSLKQAEAGGLQTRKRMGGDCWKRTTDYTSTAISLVDQIVSGSSSSGNHSVTTKNTRSLRSKLLYRRSKANFLNARCHTDGGANMCKKEELLKLFASAQRDLQQIISIDANNKAAHNLLREIKEYAGKKLMSTGIIPSTSDSPMGRALRNLRDENGKENGGYDKIIKSLKFIHATLLDDLTNAVHELLLYEARGAKQLVDMAFSFLSSGVGDDESESSKQMRSLALQSLSTASALPTFASSLQSILEKIASLDKIMFGMIVQSTTKEVVPFAEELTNAAISLQIRLTLHSHLVDDENNFNRDDPSASASASKPTSMTSSAHSDKVILSILSERHQSKVCREALRSRHESVRSMAFNLLSAWMEPDPLPILQSIQEKSGGAGAGASNSSETISYGKKEPSAEEVRQMAPRDLAMYRKRCFQRTNGRKERSRSSAMYFCSGGGLDAFIAHAASSAHESEGSESRNNKQDGYWRREYVIAVGRIINHAKGEEVRKGEEEGAIYIDENTKSIVKNFFHEKEHRLTIEEISDEDLEDDGLTSDRREIQNCMKKCLFITSLLLANGEVGAWALKESWTNARDEWGTLASSGDYGAMAVAAECASAAAGVEGARSWIHSCMDATNTAEDGAWRQLLSCGDREVRSGAASAMAKLGLADKSVSSDEGELFALLEVAAGLIEEERDIDNREKIAAKSDKISSKSLLPSAKNHQAPMERGVELLSYLSSKTTVKEEIALGFTLSIPDSSSAKKSSILKRLVDLADPIEKGTTSPSIAFSLATIFASLSVSIDTLRKEAFADKEITPEQYDQIQAMGKTEDEQKDEESKRERDDPDEVRSRIKSMARHDVPRALVNLMEGASEGTLEQTVIAMMRMADETSVRGIMIQQGCLSACIKLMKNGDLTEAEKKIMRCGQHAIAKILVTTNPSLLKTSQCMGAIKPLLLLVRDTESSDLQKFESLLSLTNLASHNDNTKQRIVSEKGISILSYAMFSNHELVRRAATEALSNLVPHPAMIEHLQQAEKLKVWIAFSCDFDENFECSRAALGCLAMVTQDKTIAAGLTKASNSKGMIKDVLECGNLELMHRMLVIVMNLMGHGDECKDLIISSGTVAFCEAYAQSYQNGGCRSVNDLDFSPSDRKLMDITVKLAQEVVSMA